MKYFYLFWQLHSRRQWIVAVRQDFFCKTCFTLPDEKNSESEENLISVSDSLLSLRSKGDFGWMERNGVNSISSSLRKKRENEIYWHHSFSSCASTCFPFPLLLLLPRVAINIFGDETKGETEPGVAALGSGVEISRLFALEQAFFLGKGERGGFAAGAKSINPSGILLLLLSP